MAFETLLDHRCSIYHMKKSKNNIGYAINANKFSYDDIPNIQEVPCHFNLGNTGSIEQTDVANEYIVVGKLQLPIGTEIYMNDKIVDLDNGIEYIAEIPRNIRDHHIIVNVQRKGKVKGAL